MGPFKASRSAPFHQRYDPVSFLHNMVNPLNSFMLNVLSYGIFSNLYLVQLLKTGYLLPWCGALFQLQQKSQSAVDFSKVCLYSDSQHWELNLLFYNQWMILTIYTYFVNITLGIDWFCNDVSCWLCSLTLKDIHFTKTCIQEMNLIGSTD